MLKKQTMPNETLSELLHFIAENEKFHSVEKCLSGSVTVVEVRTALRELAHEVKKNSLLNDDSATDLNFSSKTKEVMSSLSPSEGKVLLSAFGLSS